MQLSEEDEQELKRLEESLWRSEVRFSLEKMEALLANDFIEFGSSSRIYNKRKILETPVQEIGARLPFPDFCTKALAKSVVLITYKSILDNPDGSQRQVLRSSIWMRTDTGWRIVFHQGTPVPPANEYK